MAIRAVLFDLDGTLWGDAPGWKGDEADYARLTEFEARRLAPLFSAWEVALDPLELTSEFWSFARRREEEDTASGRAVNGPELLSELLAKSGVRLRGDQVRAAWAALDVPASETGRVLFGDTASTLARLSALSLSMAVVSNRISGAEVLASDFREMGIEHHFRSLICSAHVGWRKPHPAVFERALETLGAGPDEALMVGDSFENDVRGARALGMRAALKLNGREATSEERHEADYVINDLAELLELGLF